MAYNNIRPVRGALGLCSVALLTLGTSACMMAGMRSSPAMMEAHSAMHHFTMAVHMGEIEEAQLALSKATNPQAREFAQRMVQEHTAAMQNEQQMMASMGMPMGMAHGTGANAGAHAGMNHGNAGTPGGMSMDMQRMRAMLMEHPHSRPVVENHMQAMQVLRAASGAAFDRAYLERQVAAHRYALENVDRMMSHMGMTPAASGAMAVPGMTAEQAALHRRNREMIASHLQRAQQILGSMRTM